MRTLLTASIVAIGLGVSLQSASSAPLLRSGVAAGAISKAIPVASHKCGQGQRWVPAGYAKHGKYRAGHCAPA
jgi:hypothetical protein